MAKETEAQSLNKLPRQGHTTKKCGETGIWTQVQPTPGS